MQSRLFRIVLNLLVIVGLLIPAGALQSAKAAARQRVAEDLLVAPAPPALGEPAQNDYYLIMAVDTIGQTSAAKRVGAFDFALMPGEP